MDFAPANFDKIVMTGATEHIRDLRKLWRDCRRLLANEPSGRLIVQAMVLPVAARRPDYQVEQISGESSFIQEYSSPSDSSPILTISWRRWKRMILRSSTLRTSLTTTL